MSENSKIEWTDSTFNPWEGCQKVGTGCDHCYAETRNARFGGGTAVNWGPGAPRRRTSQANWRKPLAWAAAHAEFFAVHGRRQRVFCASLADVFDNAVDPAWRTDLFRLIADTPNLDWLLLTKRIGNVAAMVQDASDRLFLDAKRPTQLPDNVWLGATIVNQAEADRDIPKLLAVPARVRFLSMEPLLGPVDLTRVMRSSPGSDWSYCDDVLRGFRAHKCGGHISPENAVDWVIVGGESGPGARPMHPDWARSLRDQCAAAGVPFMFKQWGEWAPGENAGPQMRTEATAHWWDGEWSFSSITPRAAETLHCDDSPDLWRCGKRAAGRHLDGRTHDEFPEA
ncbi:phage Gp37/Gp68 family protein [Burkholderia cenocepacia]|uniref:phage Gp37/Gp68 family protein n=1 Tax=Burkholderia cenocepacia TaxID=95486 RepID=UPI00285DA93B|nr:phage Gp37/Gp68 family protein [Burkholderia cenocepacia]MDR8027035.1 phage Gp37/Gp68 family protein [Burkholderia cenocepacia]MDR8044287.1 phage Gp37/Gp68 family protein [Burkholderia cenocepacia]